VRRRRRPAGRSRFSRALRSGATIRVRAAAVKNTRSAAGRGSEERRTLNALWFHGFKVSWFHPNRDRDRYRDRLSALKGATKGQVFRRFQCAEGKLNVQLSTLKWRGSRSAGRGKRLLARRRSRRHFYTHRCEPLRGRNNRFAKRAYARQSTPSTKRPRLMVWLIENGPTARRGSPRRNSMPNRSTPYPIR